MNLNVDNVVDRPDLKVDVLHDVVAQEAVLLDVHVNVGRVVDVDDEVVVVEEIQDDEDVVTKTLEVEFEVVDVE